MDQEALKDTLARIVSLSKRQNDRSEAVGRSFEQAAADLGRNAEWLGKQSDNLTRAVLDGLQTQAGEYLSRGMRNSFDPVATELRGVARDVGTAAAEIQRQREVLSRERRSWLVLGSGGLLIGAVLAIGASVYTVRASYQEVEKNRVAAELLQAINRSDLIRCGEGLCANIDDGAERIGDRKQYRQVKAKP